jgi:predicted GNAT family N-acyltransferase
MANVHNYSVASVSWRDAQAVLCAIRYAVFVDEQHVPRELELDGLDPGCVHVLATDGAGRGIGAGRLLPDGHIGRMAVLPVWRRLGVGSAMLATLMELARLRGDREVILNAQTYVIRFYERAGFAVTSAEFMEAGIAHVEMRRRFL